MRERECVWETRVTGTVCQPSASCLPAALPRRATALPRRRTAVQSPRSAAATARSRPALLRSYETFTNSMSLIRRQSEQLTSSLRNVEMSLSSPFNQDSFASMIRSGIMSPQLAGEIGIDPDKSASHARPCAGVFRCRESERSWWLVGRLVGCHRCISSDPLGDGEWSAPPLRLGSPALSGVGAEAAAGEDSGKAGGGGNGSGSSHRSIFRNDRPADDGDTGIDGDEGGDGNDDGDGLGRRGGRGGIDVNQQD